MVIQNECMGIGLDQAYFVIQYYKTVPCSVLRVGGNPESSKKSLSHQVLAFISWEFS